MSQGDEQLDDLLLQDPELAASFIAEAKEHLDSIEDDFLRLEEQLDNPDPELLNKIFRAIHSVKGSAGFLSLDRVTELSHTMESLLTRLRSGELHPNSDHIDALLAGVDQLSIMLADIEHCNSVDISSNLAQLTALLEAKDTAQKTETAVSTGIPVREEGSALDKIALDMGSTIRLQVDILDKLMLQAGELVLVRNQHMLNVNEADADSRSLAHRLDVATSELQQTIISARMQPIGKVVGKFPRVVRDLGKQLGKDITINITGGDAELDRTILETLADPLTHIIRNSCGHGIEPPAERQQAGKSTTGHINISAYHEGGRVNIEISDDGRGIDLARVRKKAIQMELKTEEELARMSDKATLQLIFVPGFSTVDKAGGISGRGVGMDVVKTEIEKLGGSFDLKARPGLGVTILLRLPLTLAIIPSLVVTSGDELFAIPQANLQELFCIYDQDVREKIERADDQEVYRLRNHLLPIVRLSEVLNRPERFSREIRAAIAEQNQLEQDKLYFTDLVVGQSSPEAEAGEQQAKNSDTLIAAGGTVHRQTLNCVVLKAGGNNYGLVVEDIRGTEEIVVKPIHQSLQKLEIYSGVTIMGNGQSALILDAEGIARHAGVVLDISEQSLEHDDEELKSRTVLLFKSGKSEQLAAHLRMLRRIEPIKMKDVELIGDREFITVQGTSTLILRLDHVLDVSSVVDQEEMFLIIPRNVEHPVGFLASSLVDIEEISIELDENSLPMDGLLGSCVLRNIMSLFIDIPRILELSEPQWFDKPDS
jgi:two-component system chemotaxis sensor kinase CheA